MSVENTVQHDLSEGFSSGAFILTVLRVYIFREPKCRDENSVPGIYISMEFLEIHKFACI